MKDNLVKAILLQKNKPPIMEAGRGRVLSQHAVMYIVEGHGFFEDAYTTRREVTPGTVFYLFPGVWHCFDPAPGTVWTEYWVLFDGHRAAARFGDLLPSRPPVHSIGLADSIMEAYELLYELWSSSSAPDENAVSYLLHRILGECYFRIHRLRPDHRNNLVNRALMFMRRYAERSDLDLRRFADRENISYEHFRKQFRKAVSLPPRQYFLKLKVDRARELLINSADSVKQIAFRLGFDDEYYFSRLFKSKEGVSPRQFRKNLIGGRSLQDKTGPPPA